MPLSIWMAATCAGIATHEMTLLRQSAGEPKSGVAVFGCPQDASFVTMLCTPINERAAGVGLRMAGKREVCVGELHYLKGDWWSSKCSRRAVGKRNLCKFVVSGRLRCGDLTARCAHRKGGEK